MYSTEIKYSLLLCCLFWSADLVAYSTVANTVLDLLGVGFEVKNLQVTQGCSRSLKWRRSNDTTYY